MEISTWCDPNYFKFCNALIRSIRYHENEHIIHLNLLDFSESEFELVQERFKNDSKINFIHIKYNDFEYDVIDKVSFYQNHRPRFFLDSLKKSKNGKLCTFGANGLIWTKLDFIENHLDTNDFIFLERQKRNIHTSEPALMSGINDVQYLVENGIDIDKILDTTSGKVVLLGTHAMRNNDVCIDILNRWIQLVENTASINRTFSDMNYFVKAVVQYQMDNNVKIETFTTRGTPRVSNELCDTDLHTGNKIWFAKGPQKWDNRTYLDVVDRYWKWDDYRI